MKAIMLADRELLWVESKVPGIGRIEDQQPLRLRAGDVSTLRRAGEHPVGGLVLDRDRAANLHPRQIDDADAVGCMVDDPGLAARSGAHGHLISLRDPRMGAAALES